MFYSCHFSLLMTLQSSHDDIFMAGEYDKALSLVLKRLGEI